MNYNDVIKSANVVLVEFYASWCPHCQRMMPIVAEIKELLEGKVDVYQFDIDENQATADAEKIDTIPTFIVYKNGVEQWRQSGEMEGGVLLSKIKSYI